MYISVLKYSRLELNSFITLYSIYFGIFWILSTKQNTVNAFYFYWNYILWICNIVFIQILYSQGTYDNACFCQRMHIYARLRNHKVFLPWINVLKKTLWKKGFYSTTCHNIKKLTHSLKHSILRKYVQLHNYVLCTKQVDASTQVCV